MATLLVLLQCGWVIVGAALRMAAIESPVFPSLPGFDKGGMLAILIITALVACCQVIAVWRASVVFSFIVGMVFAGIGMLGLTCGFLALLMMIAGFGHDDGDWDWLHDGLLPYSFVATWLFISAVMLQAAHSWRSVQRGDSSAAGEL